MRRRRAPATAAEEPDDSAYAAMTDMMVGVLFIFIILLGVFAVQVHAPAATPDPAAVAEGAQAAARASLTTAVAQDLRRAGVVAPTAARAGMIAFLADGLFAPGRASLSPGGRRAAAALSASLRRRLACGPAPRPCPGAPALKAVQVIGQAGVDPATAEGRAAAALSLERASAFARALARGAPEAASRIHASALSTGAEQTPDGGAGQAIGVQLLTD